MVGAISKGTTTFYKLFAHFHGFVERKDEVLCDGNFFMRQLVCNKEGISDGEIRRMIVNRGQIYEPVVGQNFE
jgi:hypothetical protein